MFFIYLFIDLFKRALFTQNFFKDVDQNLTSDIKEIYEGGINDNMIGFGFFTSGKPDEPVEEDDEDLRDRRAGWLIINSDDHNYELNY